MRLEKWWMDTVGFNRPVLWGLVYGSPNFEEGQLVHTSAIKQLDLENKKVVTQTSVYELGTMRVT